MKEPVPFYNTVVFNLAKDGPYTKAINEQYLNINEISKYKQ